VIEPDVTGFDLTEFMRAKDLAAIGEAAALEQIFQIPAPTVSARSATLSQLA
jgi:hypothetical protein